MKRKINNIRTKKYILKNVYREPSYLEKYKKKGNQKPYFYTGIVYHKKTGKKAGRFDIHTFNVKNLVEQIDKYDSMVYL